MTNDRMRDAHKYCTGNMDMLEKDSICGCFYCLKIFSSRDITEYINDKTGKTAKCPHCGVDSVIGEGSGYPITTEFLEKMHGYWFSVKE